MTEPSWHVVARFDDVAKDDVVAATIGDAALAIVRTNDNRVFVLDATCTHGRASLADGFVDGTEIECPKHNGRFEVTTGEAVASPARAALRTYPCRLSDGCIEVQL
ncbi:MAG: non-heme iron oxygenase ferredoxin subunit [Acidobacteria bacterium]|nr:non-heme iron oxygenase ferredoxin subunit [Acidobacteriota bacterium]